MGWCIRVLHPHFGLTIHGLATSRTQSGATVLLNISKIGRRGLPRGLALEASPVSECDASSSSSDSPCTSLSLIPPSIEMSTYSTSSLASPPVLDAPPEGAGDNPGPVIQNRMHTGKIHDRFLRRPPMEE
eukprot:m.297607 g.297607  ORF g.297607 m.297607 type:complete len:130 (+) comp20083_c0_seq10:107-496(+)